MNYVQKMCPQGTPEIERRKINVGDIYRNSIKCTGCDDVVTSINRHDYASCACGSCSVDGGTWYIKTTADPAKIQMLTEHYAKDTLSADDTPIRYLAKEHRKLSSLMYMGDENIDEMCSFLRTMVTNDSVIRSELVNTYPRPIDCYPNERHRVCPVMWSKALTKVRNELCSCVKKP